MATNKSDSEFFCILHEKELEYYIHLLNFPAIAKQSLSVIETLSLFYKDGLVASEASSVKDLLFKINSSFASVRSLESINVWGAANYRYAAEQYNNCDLSYTYQDLSSPRQTSDEFIAWKQEVKRLYESIIQLRNEYIISNMGLVSFTIYKGMNLNTSKIDKETRNDLMQEGYFGLAKAIDKFSPSKGAKFSTCAVWWIKHYIQRHLENKHAFVRTPTNTNTVRNQVNKFKNEFVIEMDRLPTDEEITEGTGYSKLTLNTIIEPTYILSLDNILDGSAKQNKLDKLLFSQEQYSSLDTLITYEYQELVSNAINSLLPIEQTVLSQRFGLGAEKEKSFAEIAKELNVSKETVRQIHLKSLGRVRKILATMDKSS